MTCKVFKQILTSFFQIYWTWHERICKTRILGPTKNCGWWSDIENIKLPEIICAAATSERTLSINILELLFTLLCCDIWHLLKNRTQTWIWTTEKMDPWKKKTLSYQQFQDHKINNMKWRLCGEKRLCKKL